MLANGFANGKSKNHVEDLKSFGNLLGASYQSIRTALQGMPSEIVEDIVYASTHGHFLHDGRMDLSYRSQLLAVMENLNQKLSRVNPEPREEPEFVETNPQYYGEEGRTKGELKELDKRMEEDSKWSYLRLREE